MKEERYIETTFSSADELIDRAVKTRNLNVIAARVVALKATTDNPVIISLLETIKATMEDAYNIDMYKFQFTLFSNAIIDDLQNIEDMIKYE